MAVKTQKAKGIVTLGLQAPVGFSVNMVKKVKVYPHDPVSPFPFFARPCPMVPRHGFVESRLIETQAQFDALLDEIKATNEPEAEVVMMPYIQCQFSGVLTQAGVSYGPGNAGVTGGQEARSIPAALPTLEAFAKTFLPMDALNKASITESPYLEFVESNGGLEAVQLRNGPTVPLSPRYVPKPMVVQSVVTPSEEEKVDLLAWEKRMQAIKGQPGIVVHYPGGSMQSHVAVQAIEQTKYTEHPCAVYVTPDAPAVGDSIESIGGVDPLTATHFKELAAMIAAAVATLDPVNEKAQEQAIRLAVAALHASPLWDGARHLLVLRAVALASMIKFSSAAILGELRHYRNRGPGAKGMQRYTEPLDEDERVGNLHRDQIYERAFRLHVKLLAPRIGSAYRDFITKGWGGSYGGKNWAACTKQTILLFNGLSAFIENPCAETWVPVMSAWNGTVNVFHNTGKFLNKFISAPMMDKLAVAPIVGLIGPMVGHFAVHDEDFPLHRNPLRVAAELKVVVPKPRPKPVVPVWSTASLKQSQATLPAMFKLKGNKVYIQVQLPYAYTRPYGAAFLHALAKGSTHKTLSAMTFDGTSLAGTGTPYMKGDIKQIHGAWVLVASQNQYWIPLLPQALDAAVTPVPQQDSEPEEDVTFA